MTRNKSVFRLLITIALVVFLAGTNAGLAAYNPQSAKQHSGLWTADDKVIWDYELANWIDARGIDLAAHSMILTFGECYGGGMIDELKNQLVGPFVASSASLHNGVSYNKPGDHMEYLMQWRTHREALAVARHNTAEKEDRYGPTKKNKEQPQIWPEPLAGFTAPNKITIGGPKPPGLNYAVLYWGKANQDEQKKELKAMYEHLVSVRYPQANIYVLGPWAAGIPAAYRPAGAGIVVANIQYSQATRNNLENVVLPAIGGAMAANVLKAQFLFVAGDHGCWRVDPQGTGRAVIKQGKTATFTFQIDKGAKKELVEYKPRVFIEFSGLTGNKVTVTFNGHDVGTLSQTDHKNYWYVKFNKDYINEGNNTLIITSQQLKDLHIDNVSLSTEGVAPTTE